MAFMHIYHSMEVQYEVTASPKLDKEATEALQLALCQFPKFNVNTTSKENYQSYIFSKPLDLVCKSHMLVRLLHLLESGGWQLVAGKTIHDHEGMLFRKPLPGSTNCVDIDSNHTDNSEPEDKKEPIK